MIILETIRNNLIEAIKTSGMSQKQIAEKLNVRQQTISQYVNGQSMPSLDTFATLCVILDVDSNEILGIKQ